MSGLIDPLQLNYYDSLLRRGPLESDAKREIARIIQLLKLDPNIGIGGLEGYLYALLSHSLSPTQTILLRNFSSFRGDVLRTAYAETTSWNVSMGKEEWESVLEPGLDAMKNLALGLGRPALNSAQLAFFLLFDAAVHDMSGTPIDVSTSGITELVDLLYDNWTDFWSKNGIAKATMRHLAAELLAYDGTTVLSPEDIAGRFVLSLSVGPGGLCVRPIERWGIHSITEADLDSSRPTELWLPNDRLVRQAEIEEFEDLLNASSASEADWQRFLDAHPTFLYLIGDYDAHRREVHLSQQVMMDDCDDPALRPDFLLRRADLNDWDLLEIKLPNSPVASGRNSRRRLSSAASEAVSQVQHYADFFRDRENVKWFQEKHKLNVSYPRLNVLIGRDHSFRSNREKMRLTNRDDVRIMTYDDLHRIATHNRLTTG